MQLVKVNNELSVLGRNSAMKIMLTRGVHPLTFWDWVRSVVKVETPG